MGGLHNPACLLWGPALHHCSAPCSYTSRDDLLGLEREGDGKWLSQAVEKEGRFHPYGSEPVLSQFLFARKRMSHVLTPSSRQEAICISSMQNRCPTWFQKLPSVSLVSLQAPLLFYRIPSALPTLHLKKVTAPLLNLETTNQSGSQAEAIST